MIKERVSLPKGNDGVFSVFVYKQAQEIHGSIGQEVLRQNREALNLSEVQNLSVKAKNTFSGKMKELPYHIKNDSEHPNLLFVEFPKELQEIASFNLIIEFDIPLESLADKLLHRLVELPFVEITKSTEKAPMVEDVVFVADVVPAIIGEKGERGEQGLQGIQGERGERGEQGIQGLQGERGQDGINGTNGENGRDGRDGEKGKSALELLNEENSTEHSSITEALKALMPKSDSDSKGLEFLFHEWAENISISRMMLKGELRFILDNFDHFRDIVLKYKKDNNIGYYNVAEILKEVTPLSIAESFYKKGWGSLYIYPNFINHSRFHKGDCYFEYAILGRDDVHPSYLPASVSLPDEESKVRILVIDRVTKTGGLFEVDFTNIRSEIDKEDDHHILLYTDDEFTNHSIDEFDKFMISESGENFREALSGLGIQDIENFRPLFYKSFAIKSVADVDFDYLNNSFFENRLPTDDSAI